MKRLVTFLLCVFFVLFCISCVGETNEDNLSDNSIGQGQNNTVDQTELCTRIEKSLSVNEIDKAVTLSSQLKKPLKEDEKSIVMNALSQRINNRIRIFMEDFGSKDSLISDSVLEEVNKYKIIVDNVGITSTDNTNIDEYLDKVADLNKYKKYNDYWVYYYEVTEDWNKANSYWEYACDSYSDYAKEQHLIKAKNHFNNCINATYSYNSSSFGIKEAREFLQMYIDKINYYFNTGKDMSLDYSKMYAYETTSDELISKANEFLDEIKSFPTSVYYD